MTRFLAEQLSTAHWFDQRETRELLDWTPAVSIDEGLAKLAEHYGSLPAARFRAIGDDRHRFPQVAYQRPFRGRGWQTGQV